MESSASRESKNRRRSDEDLESSSLTPAHAETVWPDLSDDPTQYVTFMLAGELFAVGAPLVCEMHAYRELVKMDRLPPCARGRIDFESHPIPVIDPLALFGKESSDVTRRTCIMVCEMDLAGERHPVGIVVDALSEVMEITHDEIRPVASDATCGGGFIVGRGMVRGRVVNLLAIDKVFSAPATHARAAVVREAARRVREEGCGTPCDSCRVTPSGC